MKSLLILTGFFVATVLKLTQTRKVKLDMECSDKIATNGKVSAIWG